MNDQGSEQQCQPWTYVSAEDRTGSLAKKYESQPQMLLDELEKQPRGKRLSLLLSALVDTGWPVPERYARPETAGAPDRPPPYRPDQLVAPLEGRHELHLTGTPRHRTWCGDVLRISGPIGPAKGEEARSGNWCAKYSTKDYGPDFFMRGKEIAVKAESAEVCARRLQSFLRGLGHEIEIVLSYPHPPADRAEPGSAEAAQRLREFYRTFPTIHDPERPSLNLGWHHRPEVSLTAGRPFCMGCGHLIKKGRATIPAFEYFFKDDPGSPRVVACWECWHASKLPDLAEYSRRLAELYREWHVLTGGEPPEDREGGSLVLHGMAARKLVLGGQDEEQGKDFRRYCRLRLSECCHRMNDGQWHHLSMRNDLEGVAEAYNRGFDFPAPESWACIAQDEPQADTPEGFRDRWMVAGDLNRQVGLSLGYNAFSEVLLRFEDGAVMAFAPHQLLPAESEVSEDPASLVVANAKLTVPVDAARLNALSATYSAQLIAERNHINEPFTIDGADDLWICTGRYGDEKLKCHQVIPREQYVGETNTDAYYEGRVVTHRRREYVLNDRMLWVTLDESAPEEATRDLARLYRDWISVTVGGESAHPSEETQAKYQRWAEELVVGGEREREGFSFRCFCRLRLQGKSQGLDLAATVDAFRNQVDCPPPEDWECLEESDESFLNRSWESGRTPSRPCVRCGRPPGDEDEDWVWCCGTPNYLCPACQADVLAWADRRRETYKQEVADHDRAMRQARARAREKADLPAGFPSVVEVDLGHFKGWAPAEVVKVKDTWLYYRLPNDEKPRKVKLIGEDIVWRKLPMQM
jgi:hypothetical protein